jgi:hypothetical protein
MEVHIADIREIRSAYRVQLEILKENNTWEKQALMGG